jgi:cell wall-associated NlpC family hydrolase
MEYSNLLGTPFVFGGRDASGMDCWGLIVAVYRAIGIGVEDVEPYAGQPTFGMEILTSAWHAVEPPYEPYDVLLFAGGCCGDAATHAAVWIGNGRMLHALDRIGVCASPLRHFKRRLISAYRHEAVSCLA